ncbi:MAG: group I intron-associated PD-(D/E)XK endonuclease, partial [Gaiellaceae bacterium]
MLTTDQKGAIAETAMVHEATKLGIPVFKPVMEGSRCDFVLDVAGCLLRIQCKWASLQGDVIDIRCYSARRSAAGFIKRAYTC